MKVKSIVLGETSIRNDIYRIIATSISNNDFGYTFCSDCLYKATKQHKWRRYRSTIWARDNLVCEKCGVMTQATFDAKSTEAYKKQQRKKKTHGT